MTTLSGTALELKQLLSTRFSDSGSATTEAEANPFDVEFVTMQLKPLFRDAVELEVGLVRYGDGDDRVQRYIPTPHYSFGTRALKMSRRDPRPWSDEWCRRLGSVYDEFHQDIVRNLPLYAEAKYVKVAIDYHYDGDADTDQFSCKFQIWF